MSDVISKNDLLRLVDQWLAEGKRVIGPVKMGDGVILYAPVAVSGQLVLDGFVHPANSIKEAVFPRSETIYTYTFNGQEIELSDVEPDCTECIVIGARPCDAASLPILDHLFNWDYQDKFYNARRAATTVVTLACTEYDDDCFCTSVGLGPAANQGSDAMLSSAPDGAHGTCVFEVRALTDKGQALFGGKTGGKTSAAEIKVPISDGPAKKFDTVDIETFLKNNYESEAWRDITMRCLGCGACAYNCPTCHCFDIVDEGDAAGGRRVKNWDSCQFGQFTVHASGHNPRAVQAQRQRQRIQHKFRIYPEKFGAILCTGCGTCTRNCPVGLGVLNTLEAIAAIARASIEVK
ncbi:MAG TPA: 4Fe-4S dicluster domain-containing protein [Candidatus Bathyarchaeia archaeon]|nr:4Fe-4S dicluster domain-containing protein [Candidatus Bathyarchaeia archaeon]